MRIEQRAQHLRIEHGLKRRPLPIGHFHVTLHSIDTYPYFPQRVASTLEAVAATIRMPPFDIILDLARSFHRTDHDRPFVLLGSDGAAALKEFHGALGTTLKKAGFNCNSTSSFTPHLTLLYDKREVDERAIEPVRWTAREFVLVDSLVGQTKHVQLARWPLLTRSSI
ncbi:2'-5' RNA ligase family protein [Caballeronia sp. SEWSISQ10-4 2]|nr:2'-5' RNA ligase family protein [Caballeronia sp. SEWSISQ10-4 2]MDN7180028.1 2'-5' RNA ligase family protein [Caballeronia sp. SEWSISQ10-4 2]